MIKNVQLNQRWARREPTDDNYDWQPLTDRLQFYAD
jgi:hypothetical protein